MTRAFYTRIAHKRDTSANWTTNNPVLLYGEIILVDTADGELRMKVGDGVKTYTQLPFTDEALRSLISNGGGVTEDEVQALVSAEVASQLAVQLSALNIGFAADESDMPVDYAQLQIVNASVDGETLKITTY